MTVWEMLNSPLRLPVMVNALILLTGQMTLIIAAFRMRRDSRLRAAYILHFLAGFLLVYLPMLTLIWRPGEEYALPEGIRAYGAFSVAAVILYEALYFAVLTAAFLEQYRYSRNHPTAECVKETMDLLPAGIAFGRPDGTVVFRNRTMNGLSRRLTGKGMTGLFAFRDAVSGSGDSSGEESVQVRLPDGAGVWQITSEAVETDGEKYIQMTATDITEQAAIAAELAEKNRKLRELQMRLEIYNRQANRIVIAQELLTARMAVHNEVGNVLLESRHYLKDPASIDEGMLLQALKNTNTYLLREYEEDDTDRDPLADALETAEAIGVEVTISGVPPVSDPARSVLAAAVSECATNTVKHAEGDRLYAEIRSGKHPPAVTFILRNNGNPPKETVRETGGLLSLRALAEKHGGSMRIISDPSFRLILTLPAD